MIKKVFINSIFVLVLCACSCTQNSVEFKVNSDQTGIFEADPSGKKHRVLGDSVEYSLKSTPSVAIDKFEKLEISDHCYVNEICVDFQLSKKGAQQYKDVTKRNLNKRIFYVIDGVIISAPEAAGIIASGMGQFPISESMFDSLFVKK